MSDRERCSHTNFTHMYNPYWNKYSYWCHCECSLTISNTGEVGHLKTVVVVVVVVVIVLCVPVMYEAISCHFTFVLRK